MWTLIHAGVEQTFEDWGFGQLKRTLASQGPDYVTFQHANAQSMTDTQLFTRGDIIEVWRDRIFSATDKKFSGGTRFFYGLVIEVPRTGAGDSESLEYKIAGPWWYLEHKVYEQTWYFFRQYTVPTDPRSPPLYNELTTSHIIINQKILKQGQLPLPGQYLKLSTGQQIRDVLEWCRSLRTEGTSDFIRIAPFDIGDEFPSLDLNLWTLTNPNTNIPTDQAVLDALDGISPNVDVPLDVDVDKACSEIIRKQLRWAPDSVTWFDYTTTPYPTFHCKRRRSLPKTDVPFSTDPITGDDGPVAGLSVSPRYDLQVPMVKITFEFAITSFCRFAPISILPFKG